jgi:hypothetical protein
MLRVVRDSGIVDGAIPGDSSELMIVVPGEHDTVSLASL